MISIVTPVFNGERFIEACIMNVARQNCPEVEHVIMDGGSTDRTVEIVKEYAERYPHIRWASGKDRGQSDAMNKGVAMARGEIIGMLNVDDDYEPGVLNRVVEIFRDLPEPSFVVGNCNAWDEHGALMSVNRPARLAQRDLLLGPKINQFPINPSAYFYHKSVHERIGPYEVDEHFAMDFDFLLRVVAAAHTVHVDETWGNARLYEECKSFTSMRNGVMGEHNEQVLRKYLNRLPLPARLAAAFRYELHNSRSGPWRLLRRAVRKLGLMGSGG